MYRRPINRWIDRFDNPSAPGALPSASGAIEAALKGRQTVHSGCPLQLPENLVERFQKRAERFCLHRLRLADLWTAKGNKEDQWRVLTWIMLLANALG